MIKSTDGIKKGRNALWNEKKRKKRKRNDKRCRKKRRKIKIK
jgi:hypothetical protein